MNWLHGTVSAFSDGRTPTTGLLNAGNLYLDQDGTLRPRPSLEFYGTQPLGTVLGKIFEFTDTSTGEQVSSLITVQNVGGTAKAYISTDGGAWTIDLGAITFDNAASCRFCQVDDKVLIMNKTDPLAYWDIPTATVVGYTPLTTPLIPTLVATGLTGTVYTYYYKITANSTVGETDASPEASQQVLVQREQWTPASEYITLSWTAVPSARSYNVYMGTVAGDETLIASGVTALTYKDDGTALQDVSRIPPLTNTTDGPVVGGGTVINGQVFLYQDRDDPFLVRFDGGTLAQLDFSPFNGGGATPIGRGTKEIPVTVQAFRTGKGDAAITVLCKGTNGTGKRYLMTPDSITSGVTTIDFFDITEDNGQSGTDAPDGVVLYNDNLWYPSTDGFKTTGTKPQLQNVLSTDTISETIITNIPQLNAAAMDKCVGIAKSQRIYWAVPIGASEVNSEIWVLDLARNGAWMRPWAIQADQMVLYNDSVGVTHFIVLSDNVLYEFSDQHPTSDAGIGFPTNARSGLYKFAADSLDWAKVIDMTFIFLRPQGTINLTVGGKSEDGDFSTVASQTFSQAGSVAGWGEDEWGASGWSNPTEIPVDATSEAQTLMVVDVDEELEWIDWELNTTGAGVSYQLADVIVRYVNIGTKDLT